MHVHIFPLIEVTHKTHMPGLPLSRLFAQCFGGDLQVVSMEGYGTDVYLYLNKLTKNTMTSLH